LCCLVFLFPFVEYKRLCLKFAFGNGNITRIKYTALAISPSFGQRRPLTAQFPENKRPILVRRHEKAIFRHGFSHLTMSGRNRCQARPFRLTHGSLIFAQKYVGWCDASTKRINCQLSPVRLHCFPNPDLFDHPSNVPHHRFKGRV
jgi:hypothetical protein